jgi:hypothetical protein
VVTVDDYGTIRRARRDGMFIRQIARKLGHSRRIFRHALTHAEPHPEPLITGANASRGDHQRIRLEIAMRPTELRPDRRFFFVSGLVVSAPGQRAVPSGRLPPPNSTNFAWTGNARPFRTAHPASQSWPMSIS